MIELKKYFFIIMGLLLLLVAPTVCRADTGATEKVGGTIPVIHKLFVTGEGYPNFFSGITTKDYQTGFRATNEGKVILTVLANATWKISVRGEFKPVGEYIKPASDLLIKIKDKAVIEEGVGSGGTFKQDFVDFGPLSNEDQALWMSEESGDHCQARVDYKILLGIARDIPGEYLVVVTYTISTP